MNCGHSETKTTGSIQGAIANRIDSTAPAPPREPGAILLMRNGAELARMAQIVAERIERIEAAMIGQRPTAEGASRDRVSVLSGIAGTIEESQRQAAEFLERASTSVEMLERFVPAK